MVQLSGIVIEAWSRQPIRTAMIVANGIRTMTDTNGEFSVDLQGSIASISVMHQTHETLNASVQIPGNYEFQMKPVGRIL